MSWLALALLTAALWTCWSFLGKVGLKTAAPIQATILFGVATVAIGAVSLVLGQRAESWSPGALWVAAASATLGALGMVTFYLALDRGKASLVAPVIGVYPALVALLSVVFLSERLSVVQVIGVGLAIAGVILVGSGG
jgi:bacterial/archaeal transporter family protein